MFYKLSVCKTLLQEESLPLHEVNFSFHGVIAGFPNVCGLIDGTQIPIAAPREHPECYVNRKGIFALATQVVCNHRGVITNLSCRWPGSVHDSRMLQESPLQDVLDRSLLGDHYLLGDQGYSCQGNLITPYGIVETEEQS